MHENEISNEELESVASRLIKKYHEELSETELIKWEGRTVGDHGY